MPRRRVNHTEEVRLTLGNYEREAFKDALRLNAASKAAPTLGLAAIGVGVAVGAFLLSDIALDIIKGLKNPLGGADGATRGAVNEALVDNPALPEMTSEENQGSSPYSIYDSDAGKVEEINAAIYRTWRGNDPDNATNWARFLSNNSITFAWGPSQVAIQPMRVTSGEVVDIDGETEYSSFAYQMAIRETAARRRVNQSWQWWNPFFQIPRWAFDQINGLDWDSVRVSEAPGYISDPLLWCAWARVDFSQIDASNYRGGSGGNPAAATSYYSNHVERSMGWQDEMRAFYDAGEAAGWNGQWVIMQSMNRGWTHELDSLP